MTKGFAMQGAEEKRCVDSLLRESPLDNGSCVQGPFFIRQKNLACVFQGPVTFPPTEYVENPPLRR